MHIIIYTQIDFRINTGFEAIFCLFEYILYDFKDSNSILNSYLEKAKVRENQHSQERGQMVQNIHDESMRRKSEDAYKSQELTAAMNRGIQKENESRNTADAFMDRNKKLLDKGREAVKREQSKTYFS